jgi:hypothetical protein
MNVVMRGFALLCLMFCLTVTTANAGSRESEVNQQLNAEQLMDFAKLVEKTAAQHGVRVFLLSRVGRASDELPLVNTKRCTIQIIQYWPTRLTFSFKTALNSR